MTTPHTVHAFVTDPDEAPMYAVLPDDDTRGYVIGELWEVEQLRDKLTRLLEEGTHDGEIYEFHHQLGGKWLTTTEAQEFAANRGDDIARATLTAAIRRGDIKHAEKNGRDWLISENSLRSWLNHRPKPGPKAK